MKKRVYAALMSYQVSEQEKDDAQKAMRWFTHTTKLLDQCDDHLNLIYNPFKQGGDLSADKVFAQRSMLRLYRDKVVENFNNFKKVAFKSYAIMQAFASDTQIEKLMKSFVSSVEDIEIQVNRFVDLFSNLKDDDFAKGVVAGIEHIKKEIAQLKQIVDERIIPHIQSNILARNWIDNVSEELQEKVEKKSPLIMQMVDERNKKD